MAKQSKHDIIIEDAYKLLLERLIVYGQNEWAGSLRLSFADPIQSAAMAWLRKNKYVRRDTVTSYFKISDEGVQWLQKVQRQNHFKDL